MSKSYVSTVAMILIVGLAFGRCALASDGFDVQQEYTNHFPTAKTDFHKVMIPAVTITEIWDDLYPSHEWWNEGNTTHIRWYGGSVGPQQSTYACFSFEGADEVEIISAHWTEAGDVRAGDAGASIGGSIGIVGLGGGDVDVAVTVKNNLFLESGLQIATFSNDVGWALIPRSGKFMLSELTDDALAAYVDPQGDPIGWVGLPAFNLAPGGSHTYNTGAIEGSGVLLFRFTASAASGEVGDVREIWQKQLSQDIPTMTEWGWVLLCMLLAVICYIGARRRLATSINP